MKYRLDKLLTDRELCSSREKARGHILAGNVLVDEQVITKAGYMIDEKADIRLKKVDRYVSRGGIKLEKALKQFAVKVKDIVVLDVGASTGGFTDCLLQHGAQFVYSIDVGYNQLDYRLRKHSQVAVLENQNAKVLSSELFHHPLHLAVIDVSFISLTKILSSVLSVLDNKRIIALVKPQFEIGKEVPHFKGVVKKAEHHLLALQQVNDYAESQGLITKSVTYSPIKGPKGNIEFLIEWTDKQSAHDMTFESIVEEAHTVLG